MARTDGVDQPAELARLTGLTAVYGPAIVHEDGAEYGNMVLTRLEARELGNVPMPGEPPAALTLSCQVPGGGEFLFVATHFDTNEEPRSHAPRIIEQYLATQPPTPAILAGDLNIRPHADLMAELTTQWENATAGEEKPTIFPNGNGKQIDYVLYRPAEAWRVENVRVLDEMVASDHMPMVVDLEYVTK